MNLFKKLSLARNLNKLADQLSKGEPMTKWLPTLVTTLLGVLALLDQPIQSYVATHPASAIIFAAIYAIVKGLAQSPLGKEVPKLAPLAILVLFLACGSAGTAQAQDALPVNVYAGGISCNVGASPAIAGTGLYAHLIADSGTYAFTVVDALPISAKPFTVSTNFGVGIAQKLFTIAKVPVFVPTSAGISYTGNNTGWQWSTGALASIKVKGSWRVMPNVRIVKSSVSNGAGYTPIAGILFGWGQ